MKFKQFKQSTKFKVVVGGTISFYSTAKQIRQGVGSNQSFNTAVYEAIQYLESKNRLEPTLGIVGNFNGLYQIQLNLLGN